MSIPGPGANEDLRRDLQATMAARREMGADYDDHLVASFFEKLEHYIDRQTAQHTPSVNNKLSSNQRLALGIVSIGLMVPAGIPILAISGLSGLGILAATIVLVNIFVNR